MNWHWIIGGTMAILAIGGLIYGLGALIEFFEWLARDEGSK